MARLELLPPDKSIPKSLRDAWERLSAIINRIDKQAPDLPGPFVNNAAALAANLRPGDKYRTGGDPDVIAVVD